MRNNRGFSLVELMVVVAIIAILASFAVPQYESFQAKARQKEGLTLLNSYYTATKATEGESGVSYGNFEAIGFNPSGQLHYRVVAQNGGVIPPTGPNNAACVTTAGAVCTANYADWNEVGVGIFRGAPATGCIPATNAAAGTFLVCASAIIRGGVAVPVDTWSINQRKVLANPTSGI